MLQWETRRNLRKKAGSQPAAHGKGAVRVACYSTKLEQMLAFRTKQLQRSGLGKGEMHCRAVKKERERNAVSDAPQRSKDWARLEDSTKLAPSNCASATQSKLSRNIDRT